jgi:LysR family glycine cleavage system transcriptional activator
MSRRPIPSLTGLRAFEAFARLGSMTRAAEELCVTHGAVSRQVHALEDNLGQKLITGARHELRLTEAGRKLADGLTPAFDIIAEALPGAGPARELVVSCLGTLAMKWLIPRLPRFLDAHPGVRVRIIESHEAVAFTGAAQAAIRIGDADRPDFAVLPFMDHWQGPVLSPELLARTDGSLAAILALPRLYPETFRQGWTTWAERVGVVLPEVGAEREFEHNSYMLEAAAAGLGVAITAWAFAQSEVERGRLAAPFGFEPVAEGFIYLRPKRDRDPMAEAFGRWLVEEGTRSPKP